MISHGFRKEEDKFEFNKDAGMFVYPSGHMAVRKACQGKKSQGVNRTMVYFFDVDKYQKNTPIVLSKVLSTRFFVISTKTGT